MNTLHIFYSQVGHWEINNRGLENILTVPEIRDWDPRMIRKFLRCGRISCTWPDWPVDPQSCCLLFHWPCRADRCQPGLVGTWSSPVTQNEFYLKIHCLWTERERRKSKMKKNIIFRGRFLCWSYSNGAVFLSTLCIWYPVSIISYITFILHSMLLWRQHHVSIEPTYPPPYGSEPNSTGP